MRLYTIHRAPPDNAGEPRLAAIKEGFAWPALILSAVWSLWHGLWLVTVAIAAVQMLLGWLIVQTGGDPVVDATLNLALNVVVGLVGNDLRRWTLAGRGYKEVAVIAAPDAETALHKFLSAPAQAHAASVPPSSKPKPWGATDESAHLPLLPPMGPDPLTPKSRSTT